MNGLKTFRETSWDKMWYFKERRRMLSAVTRDVGAWTASGDWLSWDTLCRGTEEEMFGDSLGPWEPVDHNKKEKDGKNGREDENEKVR